MVLVQQPRKEGSLQSTIPKSIVKKMKLKKGSEIVFIPVSEDEAKVIVVIR